MNVLKYPDPALLDDQQVAQGLVSHKEQVDYIMMRCIDGYECGGDIVHDLYSADEELHMSARQTAERILQCITSA